MGQIIYVNFKTKQKIDQGQWHLDQYESIFGWPNEIEPQNETQKQPKQPKKIKKVSNNNNME